MPPAMMDGGTTEELAIGVGGPMQSRFAFAAGQSSSVLHVFEFKPQFGKYVACNRSA